MLKLQIKDYRITNDERQFILSKVRRDIEGRISFDKEGNESTKTMGYFSLSKPQSLLKAIENDFIYCGEEDITELEQLTERYMTVVELLESINAKLLSAVKGNG